MTAMAKRGAGRRVLRDYAEAGRLCDGLRRRGKRIVFTNGVFDLFHLGHLRLLEAARRLGDVLIVGVNGDLSVKRIKGRARPVIAESARAQIVAGARAVDWCVIFTEKDPGKLLRFIRPDVLVKGSEYSLRQVVGKRFVEGYGGKVVLVPHLDGWSTTAILMRSRGG
jgi:rfaE bifunctional protein nucleotidyltransferase chain/domain